LKRTLTAVGFWSFFYLEYLIRVQSSEPLQAKSIQPPTCLDHGLHVLKPRSFPANPAPKMRERHQLFFRLRLVSKELQHPAIQTKIFSANKSAPANKKTAFMQTVIRTSRRVDSFLHEAAQNFEVFSNIQG
jgi:hypothetical protein